MAIPTYRIAMTEKEIVTVINAIEADCFIGKTPTKEQKTIMSKFKIAHFKIGEGDRKPDYVVTGEGSGAKSKEQRIDANSLGLDDFDMDTFNKSLPEAVKKQNDENIRIAMESGQIPDKRQETMPVVTERRRFEGSLDDMDNKPNITPDML